MQKLVIILFLLFIHSDANEDLADQDITLTCENSCKWNFSAPEKNGFKLSALSMYFDGMHKISVRNSTQEIFNERSLELMVMRDNLHPVYSSDNYIEISFLVVPSDDNDKPPPIQGRLTMVENNPKRVEIDCSHVNDTGLWYKFNGYPNNAHCQHVWVLPANYFFRFYWGQYGLGLEDGADMIKLHVNNDTGIDLVKFQNKRNFQLYIDIGPFDIDSNVKLEFNSDVSIAGWGFAIQIQTFACKCNSKTVFCDGAIHFYMPTSYSYCDNLHCKFELDPCPTEYGLLLFYVTSTYFDEMKVISDGEALIDISGYHEFQSSFWTLVKTSATNTMELALLAYDNTVHENQEHSKGQQRSFWYRFYPFVDKVQEQNLLVTLSLESSTVLLDMGLYKTVEFKIAKEVADRNLTILLYVSDLIFIDSLFHWQVFRNKSLTVPFMQNKCFDGENPYICKLQTNSFISSQAYYPATYSPFVAVQLGEKTDGCVFGDTIFTLMPYGAASLKRMNISQLAKPNQHCFITLMIDLSFDDGAYNNRFYYISTVWTSSMEENVKVYFGADYSKLFFEFNQQTAPTWKFISLNSKAYTIEIPAAASILFVLEQFDDFVDGTLLLADAPFQSLLTTPFFATTKNPYFKQPLEVSDNIYRFSGYNGEMEVKYTVVYFKMLPDEDFYFWIDRNEKLRVSGVGDTVTFQKNCTDSSNVIAFKNQIELVHSHPQDIDDLRKFSRIENGIYFQLQYSQSFLNISLF